MQTDEPHWLPEVYVESINRSDVGYISRNLSLSKVAATVLDTFFPGPHAGVDFGGGYGMFVRLMRDQGYDFYRLDKYCANLFAPDFEATDDGSVRYGLLTAFEVFEHLDQPIREIEKMLSLSDNILFSTEALPEPYPPLDQWKYYGLEHGQHIALYSARTLRYLANRYGLHLRSWPGNGLHLFSRAPISPLRWWVLRREKVRWLTGSLRRRRPSLLMPDYQAVVAKIKAAQTAP